jgi:hypothetical protein
MTKIKVRIVLLAIGIYYIVFPATFLIFNALQKQLSEMGPADESFANLTSVMSEIWNQYFPLLILIGGIYLLFSFFYPHIKKIALWIHIILTIGLAIWCYYYIQSTQEFIHLLLQSTNYEFEMFNDFVHGAYTLGIIVLVIMYAVPQIAIAILIIYKNKINSH